MYTLAILAAFCSVWGLYTISERTKMTKNKITLSLITNTMAVRIAAFVFFLISTLLFCSLMGNAVGVVIGVLIWMIMACSVLLIAPFPRFKLFHFLMISVLILSVELLLFFVL